MSELTRTRVPRKLDSQLKRHPSHSPVANLWWLLHGPELAFKNETDTSSAATAQVTVTAHHEDVADFRSEAPPEMLNHPRLKMKIANPPRMSAPQADGVANVVDEMATLSIAGDGENGAQRLPGAEDLDPTSHAARVLAFELAEARWEESIRASPPR